MKGLYKVPDYIRDDIQQYRSDVDQFLKGEISEQRFRTLRVPQGVYEQREPNTFMMRIRVPAGVLTPTQMGVIAEQSERYGDGICHLTTRQDIQFHWIKLEDTPKIMEELLKVGLTTKGVGGNTVRNITACYDAGVCPKEVFDVSPYAIALTEYLITDPLSYTLPRKYKIAFSGCPSDCAYAGVNDVGFIAKKRYFNGRTEEGFSVYVAGGLGAYSSAGNLLEEFIPVKEVGYIAEAIKRLFDKYGNRRNKHKARLRFLMKKYGFEYFRDLYRKEVQELKNIKEINLDIREILTGKGLEENTRVDQASFSKTEEYKRWLEFNVRDQKQEGYFYVRIGVPFGDISASDLKRLTAIVGQVGEGYIRIAQDQNFVIRGIHKDDLFTLYSKLQSIDLNLCNSGPIRDIVTCTGASTCKLGLCISPQLMKEIIHTIHDISELNKEKIKIRISGCPNACGHHPIGQIGLYGAARRVKNHMVPYYKILLGGRTEEGKTTLAKEIGEVPARNVPILMRRFLSGYIAKKDNGEDLYDFLDQSGKALMRSLIDEFSIVPDYETDTNFYKDWGSDIDFTLAGIGPGECGAGIFDLIEVDLEEAKMLISQIRGLDPTEKGCEVAESLYDALLHASRALLVTKGVEARSDSEVFESFREHFIEKRLIPQRFQKILKSAREFEQGKEPKEVIIRDREIIEHLVESVNKLYELMDDSLRFPIEKEIEVGEGLKLPDEGPTQFLDLRGVKCPYNYVKTKMKMEEINIGEILEIFLDEGEAIRNMPNSLKDDGQEILKLEKRESYYRIWVKKRA